MRFLRPRHTLDQLPALAIRPESVTTLHSAADYKAEMLHRIRSAKNRIYLCCLYLQHDEAGAEILAALHEAKLARPQLDVVVLVDWHRAQRGLIGEKKTPGQLSGNAAWYQQQAALHHSGVAIYGVPVQTRELFGVLHLKGYVFDDLVFYSGASLNNVYLHQFAKYRHDRYLLIENRALADSMTDFMREHLLASSAVHRLDQPELPATRHIRGEIRAFRARLKKAHYAFSASQEKIAGTLSVTPLVGVGKNNALNRVICQLIAHAKHRIVICTPYFNFPLAITREINRALKRGVQVDIVVGDKVANDFYIPPEQGFKAIGALPYLYEMNLRRFLKSHQKAIRQQQLQVHLWKDEDNTYHLKGMWIDDEYALMTGNNLNPRAFRLDLENALLMHDPEHLLLAQRTEELNSIMRHTRALQAYTDLDQLQDYPAEVRKLLGRLSTVRLDRLAYRVL